MIKMSWLLMITILYCHLFHFLNKSRWRNKQKKIECVIRYIQQQLKCWKKNPICPLILICFGTSLVCVLMFAVFFSLFVCVIVNSCHWASGMVPRSALPPSCHMQAGDWQIGSVLDSNAFGRDPTPTGLAASAMKDVRRYWCKWCGKG